ncbi:uncharacterized protein LOC112576945 [Pomacea canaliculata]|uniref:uncharacterized protein LOC112576945 n=1 Tax=Pomacea canaliculata TaxID=400727 RepID=UPI000D73D36F|nr:uncharacterized protein LOC112576945 [Pomacea canaliculata]XP_025115612.1 uncharacterized protein LOC112576945 [Pomacea canaliculata]
MEWSSTSLENKVSTLETIHCKPDKRQCFDGSCIPKGDLCPEEEIMSQDSILIMIGVGMGVVIFLIMLYCLQQRRNANTSETAHSFEDADLQELTVPPPSYEEALNVNIYPPTPVAQRSRRILSEEEPMTPPPNYDTALHILAQSHESVFFSKEIKPPSPVVRRSVSLDFLSISNRRPISSPPRIAGFRQTVSHQEDEGT